MNCGFKKCTCTDEFTDDNSIVVGKKKYHLQCKKDIDDMNKVADIYCKYYNEKESWAIMLRSMHNWYNQHSPEYMLFCISKSVREKRAMTNFFSFYYILNDLTYQDRYRNKDIKYFTYDKVLLADYEYAQLLEIMENNTVQLTYYIRKLNDYMTVHNKYYASHFNTLCSWYKNNEDSKPIPYRNEVL